MDLKKIAIFLIGIALISTSVLAAINTDSVTAAGNEFKTGEPIRITGTAYTNVHGMFPRIEYTLTTDEGQQFRKIARNTMIRVDNTISFSTPGTHYAVLDFISSSIVSSYNNGYWSYTRKYETAQKTLVFYIMEEEQAQEETNTPPYAIIQYYNTTPNEYVFDASQSYDSDGTIVAVEWNFGDGTTSTMLTTTHTYTGTGTYLVTLKITDDKGAESITSMQIEATIPEEETQEENHAPVAKAGEDITAYIGDQVAFNGIGTDPDGDMLNYAWDFEGDGVIDWESPISGTTTHSYDTPGTYTAFFYVSDGEYEAVDSLTVTILEPEQQTEEEQTNEQETQEEEQTTETTPVNQAPIAYAGQDKTGEVNEWIAFVGTGEDSDGSIVLYEWDFDGDGTYDWSSTANGVTTYKYDTPGTYTAILRVTDNEGATSTSSITVVIEGPETGNEPTTGSKYYPEFVTSKIDVYREYYYDASEAKTYVTTKISNLGNEPRTFLVKDVIPKEFAEHVDEVTITPAPDKIYSADPEIGWNVTLDPMDSFIVQYKFNKYVAESEFQNMTSPKIIEMPEEQANTTEEENTNQTGFTGLIVGAFASPLNALAVLVIIGLVIAFWKKETIIEKWHEIRNKE